MASPNAVVFGGAKFGKTLKSKGFVFPTMRRSHLIKLMTCLGESILVGTLFLGWQ